MASCPDARRTRRTPSVRLPPLMGPSSDAIPAISGLTRWDPGPRVRRGSRRNDAQATGPARGSSSTPAEATPKRCVVPGGTTVLARTASSVVWKQAAQWRGCAAGHSVALDENSDDNGPGSITEVTRVRLAGRYVTYVQGFFDHYGGASVSVVVVDLLGRVPRAGATLASTGGFGEPMPMLVTGLAINADGSVAWRASDAQHDLVAAFDGRGARTVATAAIGTISNFKLRGRRVDLQPRAGLRSAATAERRFAEAQERHQEVSPGSRNRRKPYRPDGLGEAIHSRFTWFAPHLGTRAVADG